MTTEHVSFALVATVPHRSGIDSSQAEGREFDSRLPLQIQFSDYNEPSIAEPVARALEE